VLANDFANGGTLSVFAVTQPANGGTVTNNSNNIDFTAPSANGSASFTYQASNGVAQSNSANVSVNYVANDARGDCNGDGRVSAVDFIATVLELFDTNNSQYQGSPAWWLIYTGDYLGSPVGCDSNASRNGTVSLTDSVSAGDIICTVLIFFDHPCGNVQAATAQTAQLTVADAQAGTTRDGSVTIYDQLPTTSTAMPTVTGTSTPTPGPGTPTVTPTVTATPTHTPTPTAVPLVSSTHTNTTWNPAPNPATGTQGTYGFTFAFTNQSTTALHEVYYQVLVATRAAAQPERWGARRRGQDDYRGGYHAAGR